MKPTANTTSPQGSPPHSLEPAGVALARQIASAIVCDRDWKDPACDMAYIGALAELVASLRLDDEAVTAAILHFPVRAGVLDIAAVNERFGRGIGTLVDGIMRMDAMEQLTGTTAKDRGTVENWRKMLLAMAEDVRVVLIKLADKLCQLRALSALPAGQQRLIAGDALDIFAPLANRLGIWRIKWEIEDLAFKHLEPELYRNIVSRLNEKRGRRQAYIREVIATLDGELRKYGIHAKIRGRAKHIYSIWKKMRRKQVDFADIFDTRAVRVLVDTVPECYNALGVVHTLWQYIPGEFDDYIATPKENDYRSIHTAVLGPRAKIVEIQIRTHEMEQHAELGIAAHWQYKEGEPKDAAYERKIAWLRQLLEWKDEIHEAEEFADYFRSETFQDRIYLFTPAGKIIDLPAGATPLDFAYTIHTELGHRCTGAKVNGRIVPLNTCLNTGERVEILTSKRAAPSRDWLNTSLAYVTTSRARHKIRGWFRKQDYDQNVANGRAVLEREFKRVGLSNINLEQLTQDTKYTRLDDLLAAIGQGDLKVGQLLAKLKKTDDATLPGGYSIPYPKADDGSSLVRVQGVGNLLTEFAGCCKPVFGDAIVGYVTRGRGVSIHRQDCANALRFQSAERERMLAVEWGEGEQTSFPVDAEILAFDRRGLLRDITTVLANDHVNVLSVRSHTDPASSRAVIRITMQIRDIQMLSHVLAKINQLPNVIRVRRR